MILREDKFNICVTSRDLMEESERQILFQWHI